MLSTLSSCFECWRNQTCLDFHLFNGLVSLLGPPEESFSFSRPLSPALSLFPTALPSLPLSPSFSFTLRPCGVCLMADGSPLIFPGPWYTLLLFLKKYLFIYLARQNVTCGMQDLPSSLQCVRSLVVACRIQFPDQGLNPGLLHWEHRVFSHWTTREVHPLLICNFRSSFMYSVSSFLFSSLWTLILYMLDLLCCCSYPFLSNPLKFYLYSIQSWLHLLYLSFIFYRVFSTAYSLSCKLPNFVLIFLMAY